MRCVRWDVVDLVLGCGVRNVPGGIFCAKVAADNADCVSDHDRNFIGDLVEIVAISNEEKLQEIKEEDAEDGAKRDRDNPGDDDFFEHLKVEGFQSSCHANAENRADQSMGCGNGKAEF